MHGRGASAPPSEVVGIDFKKTADQYKLVADKEMLLLNAIMDFVCGMPSVF
jgi:hypothetical protein